MAFKIAEAYVEVKTKLGGLKAQFATGGAVHRAISTAAGRLGTSFANLFSKAVAKAWRYAKWGILAVTGLMTAAGAAMTKFAMDAVESENLFEVSLGKMADEARAWSKEVSKALGLNDYELRKQVGTFDVMLKSMGFAEEQAYDMSAALVELAHDMASFYNLDPEDAFTKLRSGLTGMTRPLRDLGIVILDTTVKEYALRAGLIRQGEEMDETTKILARYGLIMERTSTAQGDLARTIHSPANAIRVLRARVKMLLTDLGMGLLPTVIKVSEAIGNWVKTNQELIKQRFGEWLDAVGKVMAQIPNWWASEGKPAFEAMIAGLQKMAGMASRAMDIITKGRKIPPAPPAMDTGAELYNEIAELQTRLAGARYHGKNWDKDRLRLIELIRLRLKRVRETEEYLDVKYRAQELAAADELKNKKLSLEQELQDKKMHNQQLYYNTMARNELATHFLKQNLARYWQAFMAKIYGQPAAGQAAGMMPVGTYYSQLEQRRGGTLEGLKFGAPQAPGRVIEAKDVTTHRFLADVVKNTALMVAPLRAIFPALGPMTIWAG